jgi:CubicO group peptidase (beta-lactamase class C family)
MQEMLARRPVLTGLTALAALGRQASAAPPTAAWPGARWPTARPEQVGVDPHRLAAALVYGRQRGGSGLIARNGYRIASWGSQAQLYDLKSTTKSIGAILLGVALRHGKVTLDTAVQPLLPELGLSSASDVDAGWLPRITVEQLATHTGGFDKPGGFGPLLFEPGSRWFYSDGGTNWLADLLTVRFQNDLLAVLRNRVLGDLGIGPAMLRWRSHLYRPATLRGLPRRELGSGVFASVDAMARLGILMARGGRWRTKQILPMQFAAATGLVAASVRDLTLHDPAKYPGASRRYGLLWWTNGEGALADVPTDARWAWGLNDSFILVVPSLDLVVSRAGPAWASPWGGPESLQPFFRKVTAAVVA